MVERTLVYFVSDVHLGLDVGDPALREARFVDFLDSIPRDRTLALYMLGDIWDFWFEYRDLVPKGYVKVFASLQDLMDSGVEVFFFQGNHDIWCFHYFSDMGIRVLRQPYVTTIGDKVFCLGHGDGLGPGMYSYKLMRSVFHNRVCQRLFASLIHPTLAFSLARSWSKRSRTSKPGVYAFRGEDEPLYKFAVAFSRKNRVDQFIFGHYHASVEMTLPGGAGFMILKDWMDPQSSNFALYDLRSGRLGSSQNIEK